MLKLLASESHFKLIPVSPSIFKHFLALWNKLFQANLLFSLSHRAISNVFKVPIDRGFYLETKIEMPGVFIASGVSLCLSSLSGQSQEILFSF